jgi:ornithine decarboxylase
MPTLAQTAPAVASPRPVGGLVEAETSAARTTPYLHLDPSVVSRQYDGLTSALPGTAIHYAVKANPHPDVLWALVAAGAGFDVASPAEIVACLDAGASPDRILYSNPIKRRSDLRAAVDLGVRLYVVDCMPEMLKIADEAPGASVLCRILTTGSSDWPVSRKYGCSPDAAVEILTAADSLGLSVAGVAFHVGSQQGDPGAWRAPIVTTGEIFGRLEARGIKPWLIDLGGGFPARLEGDQPGLSAYGAAIRDQLRRTFGDDQPHTAVEPGRSIVADAGVLHTSVVAVCWRGGRRWVYLDAGVFSGLVETLEEAIRYRISTDHDGMPDGPVVLAGPTCDSTDVLYEKRPVRLPLALKEGDRVRLHAAGAYTSCYSTVGFNGFAPLPTHLPQPVPGQR